MGPFELADLTGIDVSHHVLEEAGVPIPPILERKVEKGELGRKTGVGFYNYQDGGTPDYGEPESNKFDSLRIEACMMNAAVELIGNEVTTASEIDVGMRLGAGFPEGPCHRANEIGLETIHDKLVELKASTGMSRYEPSIHLVDLVSTGETKLDLQ